MEGDLMNVMRYWLKGEFTSFIKVYLSVYLSLIYSYFAVNSLSNRTARLAAILPVVFLFLLLPLQLHTVHLSGTTAFFLAWLANFKLILFAFGKGPLSDPSISLLKFIAVGCLPIKIKSQQVYQTGGLQSLSNYAIKGVVLALIIKSYDYEMYIRPKIIIMVLYSLHIYLALDIILAISATIARSLPGAELEPQFNAPFLSSSLQDFWGRRWNLMVTGILRPTVYLPVLDWSSSVVGRKWSPLPAVMSTFIVSALMHELMLYYLGRVKPTWEITWFFLLHGACLMVEIVFKKAVNGRWRLPRVVGGIMTIVFVMTTAFWLFFPQLLRCRTIERGLEEMNLFVAFVKDIKEILSGRSK